jgi:hypothetical protein
VVTIIKDWCVVYFFGMPDGSNMNERWGRVVTGTVAMDGSQHAAPGDFICSEPVVKTTGDLLTTRSGKAYSLFGEGRTQELPVTQLAKVQAGLAMETILKEMAQELEQESKLQSD